MTGTDLLREFDHEMASTRTTLARLDDEDLDFRPHPKSWSAAELAGHIANIPAWCGWTFAAPEFDMRSGPGRPSVPATVAEILDRFDDGLARARALVGGATADDLAAIWRLRDGDRVLMEMPRAAVYRSMVLNHMCHHRGQLTVYLRMCDRPVPSIYGPSADAS